MSTEASKSKGDSLVAQADKKLKSWSLFNSSKNEDAAELLEKAANNYKLAKACIYLFLSSFFEISLLGKEAADTYKKLANVYIKVGSQHEAATAFVEASKALTKIQSEGRKSIVLPTEHDKIDAVMVLHQAVEIYTDMGRLNQAARYIRVSISSKAAF